MGLSATLLVILTTAEHTARPGCYYLAPSSDTLLTLLKFFAQIHILH